MDCIFCKIIAGEVPARKIYEDEHVFAFLDIADDVDGHTLIVPKKHFVNILDCDAETLANVMNAVKLISSHYVNNCGCEGVNILNASGAAAQQTVFHLHFHIIPRRGDDGLNTWPKLNACKFTKDEMWQKLKMTD